MSRLVRFTPTQGKPPHRRVDSRGVAPAAVDEAPPSATSLPPQLHLQPSAYARFAALLRF